MKAPPTWVIPLRPPDDLRLRLYCFPHAGGGGAAFVRWQSKVPAGVHVCPVQLPGRESRHAERGPDTLGELVDLIVANVPFGDAPFALFGHSMGSLLAFEIARTLRGAGRPGPRLLIASAAAAPQAEYRSLILHTMEGPELIAGLRAYGTPEAVLAHPELLELVTPTIRADSRLVNEYRYAPGPPLEVPIAVYAASDDATVPMEKLEGWREQTTGRLTRRSFTGGHLYLHPGREAFFAALAEDLTAAMAG